MILTNAHSIIDSLQRKGIHVFKDELLDEAIYFSIEGPFDVPFEKTLVIVDKRTAESVLLGANVYAPGVLGFIGEPEVGEGKTTHIYQLTKGKAKIYAFDHSRSKIEKMRRELERLKMYGISVEKADSRYLHVDYPSLKNKVDRIVLDPPCSAIGVRPKLYDEKKYSDIVNLAQYQIQFFKPAYELLKKGGILVYSTCTVTLEENELLLEKVLEKYRFEIEKIDLKIGCTGVEVEFKNHVLRFHPHINDAPGYFIAKLRKF
ncbi:MAG: hypothetical protein B6U75_02085 [Desulfurococcales archaeon ex4484_217_1]|nr:MAG: hypothetical protein B6U75_02085 [Desulfurococcales archaeon ex4484_217_1]